MMHHDSPRPAPVDKGALGQIVLVLQGGGALGAYQAGVYQALDEAGIAPDRVIGTSIGAINAALHPMEGFILHEAEAGEMMAEG